MHLHMKRELLTENALSQFFVVFVRNTFIYSNPLKYLTVVLCEPLLFIYFESSDFERRFDSFSFFPFLNVKYKRYSNIPYNEFFCVLYIGVACDWWYTDTTIDNSISNIWTEQPGWFSVFNLLGQFGHWWT